MGILRAEKRASALEKVGFEGALAVDERGDDITRPGFAAMFDDHHIPADDVLSDHGIAGDPEGEGAAAGMNADRFDIDADAAFGVLVAIARRTGGDGAEEGDVGDVTLEGAEEGMQADGSSLPRGGGEEPLPAEGGDLLGHGTDVGDAQAFTHFAVGGGRFPQGLMPFQEPEEFLLAGREGDGRGGGHG